MAIGTSFKQQCPSCEAMVPVKDPGLVGKKIECPKCKDKFVVKSPSKKKTEDDEDDADDRVKSNGKAKAPPAKKPAKRRDDDDEDEVEEMDEEEMEKLKAKSKKKAKGDDDEEEEEEEEDDGGGKKKKKGFSMGIVLAVVGLVVLGTVAFFVLRKDSTGSGPQVSKGTAPKPPPSSDPTPITPTGTDNTNIKPKTETEVKPTPVAVPPAAINAELTNLLPNDTDHVAHVPIRLLFDPASPLRDAVFAANPDGLKDDYLRTKLGFSLLEINELIRAEHYKGLAWSFTVVNLLSIVDQDAVKKALDLKPAPAVKKYTHFQAASPNPWFEQLARVAIGVPRPLRMLTKQDNRPLFVHFHNPQTMIFADEAPMVAFLQADKRFRALNEAPAPPPPDPNQPQPTEPPMPAQPMPAQPTTGQPTSAGQPMPVAAGQPMPVAGQPMPMPGQPGDKQPDKPGETPAPAVLAPPRLETYMTIRPALKLALDRMQAIGPESRDKILFSSATDLAAARLPGAPTDDKGKLLWYPRQVWDVTLLLQDKNPRVQTLATALVQRDARIYRIRNELSCPMENDARNLEKDLVEEAAPDVARFIDRFLAHKVVVPKKEELMPVDPNNPNPPVQPPPVQPMPMNPNDPPKEKKEELPTESIITVVLKEKAVDFLLDLKLEHSDVARLHTTASLMACGLRSQMDVAAGLTTRHDLARATRLLSEKGVSERGVLPGQYPPGAFRRPVNAMQRFTRDPLHRVSWMAALLPFLGQETLYSKIAFEDSWRDPSNWIPASTTVPQFLDPAFPSSSHFVTRPELPFELATTHFVGIAGVGLDAADYDPTDPAVIHKRGVMSYEKGMTLDEIRQAPGHGLSNTIVIVQVPHDGIAGLTPWLAGGGSTLRGVPDRNSVAPFVFKDGKRRGTHVLMADGSVRFVDQNISDEVFKAMASARGPFPENFNLDAPDSKTERVKAPKGFEVKSLDPAKVVAVPISKVPEKKAPAAPVVATPEKKEAPAPSAVTPEKIAPPVPVEKALEKKETPPPSNVAPRKK